jgi:hypothetical protein
MRPARGGAVAIWEAQDRAASQAHVRSDGFGLAWRRSSSESSSAGTTPFGVGKSHPSGCTRIMLARWAKGVRLHGFFHPARKGNCYQRQYRRSRGRLLVAYGADLRPRVGGGAISASAGMPHSRCSFQAILIVRERFLVRMSDARWREPSNRPRSACVYPPVSMR